QMFIVINILDLGIDIPTIQVVIYVRIVRKLRDYTQKSKQIERDRLKNKAIILRGVTYNQNGRI
ncbi:hypothetical protein K469DRAFT_598749, partial [Zopfia rhizophila CBS 207.26]